MVLPAEELLRDARTGIRPEAADLLWAILSQDAVDRGVRGHYDLCRAVNALARVCLYLLARAQNSAADAGFVTPNEARASMGLPPTKDFSRWKPGGGGEAEPQPARDGQTRKPTLLDCVGQVLSSEPKRWFTTGEITGAILARGLRTEPLTSSNVGQCILGGYEKRGWKQRPHPGEAHKPSRRRLQYTVSGEDAS